MKTKQAYEILLKVEKQGLNAVTDVKYYAAKQVAMHELQPYNGWSNRETWAVALHIDNNQWSHNYKNTLVARVIKEASHKTSKRRKDKEVWTDDEYKRFQLADDVKDWVEDLFYKHFQREFVSEAKDVSLMIQDVGSLWRVDWQELADNYLEE